MTPPLRRLLPLALAALLAAPPPLFADGDPDDAFAAPFSSGAVLQRDCPIPVWGTTALPGASVLVALDDVERRVRSDSAGRWKVVFPAFSEPGAGHTLSLSVNGADPVVLEDIAIGDVWLCAGQENMEMNFWNGIDNGDEELLDSEYPDLRLFGVRRAASLRPLRESPGDRLSLGKWSSACRDTVVPFSACAFFFGRRLYQELGVPIGLIQVAQSGTAAASWLSLERFGRIPECAEEAAERRRVVDAWEHGGREAFARSQKLWDDSYDGSDPFEGAALQPWSPEFRETDWTPVEMPATFETAFDSPEFNGVVWFRRTVELTAEQAATSGARLLLGPIDDEDITWVNGVKVGETNVHNVARAYGIPDGLLRAGSNDIVVRQKDNGGTGGFMGKPEALALAFPGDVSLPLAGTWRARGKGIPKGPRPVDPNGNRNAAAATYNAMLAPLFPYAVRGAIWAHGCSDVDHPLLYPALVRAIAEDWRANFTSRDGAFPFYLVQVAAHQHTHRDPVESNRAALRWAQARLGEELPNAGTVVSLDNKNPWDVRTHDKRAIGDRLARLALARTYGVDDLEYLGPVPDSATVSGDQVVVSFTHADVLETSDDKPPVGFQLAGEDGRFAWAQAEIDGDTVRLAIPEGMAPKRVRHAWDDGPARNLVGYDGLPCGTFELEVR